MFSSRLWKKTACVFLAGLLAGVTACGGVGGKAVGSAQPAKVDPLDQANYEDQWQKFYEDAVANYGFSEAQTASAEAVLRSCLARAASRRERCQTDLQEARQSGEPGLEDKLRDGLKTALNKLNDEYLGRIEAIASIEQTAKAEKAGFQPPERKDPRALPEVGYKAPPFELKGQDGKAVSLESLHGKVVVLQFWATWCGYCRKAVPEIQKLHEAVKDKPDVVIYGVNCRQRPNNPDPVAFLKEQGAAYSVLLNGDSVADAYQVQGYPTMYVIGRDGKIVHKERGAQSDVAPRLLPVIERALAQPTVKAPGA